VVLDSPGLIPSGDEPTGVLRHTASLATPVGTPYGVSSGYLGSLPPLGGLGLDGDRLGPVGPQSDTHCRPGPAWLRSEVFLRPRSSATSGLPFGPSNPSTASGASGSFLGRPVPGTLSGLRPLAPSGGVLPPATSSIPSATAHGVLRLAGRGVASKRFSSGPTPSLAPPKVTRSPGDNTLMDAINRTIQGLLPTLSAQVAQGLWVPLHSVPPVGSAPSGSPAPSSGGGVSGSEASDQPPVTRDPSYDQLLSQVLPSLGLQPLYVEQASRSDPLDYVTGVPSRVHSPWGLNLEAPRQDQLWEYFSTPRFHANPCKASSRFRMSPETFTSVFRAPKLDDLMVSRLGAARSRGLGGADSGSMNCARQVSPLYEASMGMYRLAYHQSILTRALFQSLSSETDMSVLQSLVSNLAQAQQEQLALAAAAAAHSVTLQRSLYLGCTDYNTRAREAILAMPFTGTELFGPGLQQVLVSTADAVKVSQQGDRLLRTTPSKPLPKSGPQTAWPTPRPRSSPAPGRKPQAPPSGPSKRPRGNSSGPSKPKAMSAPGHKPRRS
jgi:hypothetical protein